MNEITQRLFEELKKRNLKASDLCKATGLATGTVSMWKKTDRMPDTNSLTKAAEFLGVSVRYLMTGEEEQGYYLDPETAKIAQEMYDRPELRGLFDASRKLTPEDIKAVRAMVDHLYKLQNPDD